jgi:hypothetical protein
LGHKLVWTRPAREGEDRFVITTFTCKLAMQDTKDKEAEDNQGEYDQGEYDQGGQGLE